MLTITKPQIDAIRDVVQTHKISHGVGTAKSMCSVAAINIAMSGRVIDDCPDCMSPVIHAWIIRIQDTMPLVMINAPEWLSMLPYSAGTGRVHEKERLSLIMDWMWEMVLPQLQPIADAGGYGAEWRTMCDDKTPEAAEDAAGVAWEAAAWAARAAAEAVARAAAEAVARAAAEAAARAAGVTYWSLINPAELLRRLVLISVTTDEMED